MLIRGLLFVALTFPLTHAASSGPTQLVAGRRQLFLDDGVIQRATHLKTTMHSPAKKGAVLRPDTPSDGYLVQVRAAPMWIPEEKIFKLVYLAYNQPGPAYATSKDGIHWEKPALNRLRIGGSKANNRFAVDPATPWPQNCLTDIVYDPFDKDPARRYKGLVAATYRQPVVSPNVLDWKTVPCPIIPSSDESQMTFDREKGIFMALVKSGDKYGRNVAISTSKDFVHWTPTRLLFTADDEDQRLAHKVIRARLKDRGLWPPMFLDPEPPVNAPPGPIAPWRVDIYNMAVFPYEGLYIGLPAVFYHTGLDAAKTNCDGFHHIQLAVSRDLKTWTRLGNREAFIGPSRIDKGLLGVFDRTQLLPCSEPIEKGDELWFYYSGMKWRDCRYRYHKDGKPVKPEELAPAERADLAEGHGAMCLAVLRRDGFISMDAGATQGMLLTRPLILAGKKFYVNLDAANGQARVEILGEQGKAIPGYAAADCAALTGDSVRMPVRWKGRDGLTALAGKTVRFRFTLNNASLYAFGTDFPPAR